LEDGRFERLGSAQTVRVDVRVIAATNRDLAAMVDDRRFRPDLFYRLRVFPIEVPPLRAHKEDISELVNAFLGSLDKGSARSRMTDSSRLHSRHFRSIPKRKVPKREATHSLQSLILHNRGSEIRSLTAEVANASVIRWRGYCVRG
jgi:transcriptional regulator with GAF, ATPase, and Fis domain